ncbi:SWIM zinc finger family protein [Actinokineospora pegani]|uniref:SWIM zinc finger family protein n=1 Tax=Actinokineospora pegani TaxID=2654637 RepID=UPI0018D3974E|nr:SWIM zinc finger family protein [Actinokineospora pegani]
MSRADLLALTPDALAALANRGLVKRAAKELDNGVVPEVSVDADKVVHGVFPDGVTTTLPPGAGLDAGTCSCGAPGACRHRIALVLAFQRVATAKPAPAEATATLPPDALGLTPQRSGAAEPAQPVVQRADLMALTQDALTALANRGLVKRAAKELDNGVAPEVSVDDDGTVRGVFPDGATATLPPGVGLDAGDCSCGAPGACRHRIGLVLAFQRVGAAEPAQPVAQRADLMALTQDALTALANRGLVKRAAKELDSGVTPEVSIDNDGTVRGAFPDDVVAALPPGVGLEAGVCSCGAPGVCRHRIALVLAFQRRAGDAPAEESVVDWSPGEFTDEQLDSAFGARTMAAARKAWRAGYPAHVRRPVGDDPALVELAASTVRFLVRGELGYVDTDTTATRRDLNVVLAVWAFRAADDRDRAAPSQRIDVGGTGEAADTGLGTALAAVDDVLRSGAVHAGPVLAASLRRAADEAESRNLRWPVAVLEDLSGQLTAYQERAATYRSERLAALVAELHARHRAVTSGGASLRSRVLGTEERASTPLRRVRLVGLGCRVTGVGEARQVEVYLADPHTGTVLVLRREWAAEDTTTGHDLAGRRIVGASLRSLSISNVVSESATRSAGREIRISQGQLAKTAVTPLGEAWSSLPPSLRVESYAELSAELAELPPWCVRPRVAAEFVRVLRVESVSWVSYAPGAQRLTAEIVDGTGASAIVVCDHRSVAPGALDALAASLQDAVYLSGTVRRMGGTVFVEPIAVHRGAAVEVLDLAAAKRGELATVEREESDPLVAALDSGLAVLAEAAHRGVQHASPTYADRVAAAAEGLGRVGLGRCAAALRGSVGSLKDWVDAFLLLSTVSEFR